MMLKEIMSGIRADGFVFSKFIPASFNQDSRLVSLGKLPLDGWERMQREEVGTYPSGSISWQYYKNADGTVIRQQTGTGYIFGQVTEVVK